MKKKVLLVAGLAAVLSMGLVSCGGGDKPADSGITSSVDNVIYVQDITLEAAELSVNIGETVKISASISPSNATTRGISYKSSDEAIAKVSSTGVVTGVAAGKANITVTSKGTKADGEPVVKTVAITVNEVFLTGMELAKESVKLEINGTEQIRATLTPENASVKDLEYASENAAVATVTENGLIKGISVGTTNIVVKTKGKKADGSIIEKKIAVEVIPTPIAELRIAQPTVKFNLQDDNPHPTAKIEYEILPSNASEKGVTFESSAPEVASVSADGIITANAVGEAVITVTTVAKNQQGVALTGTVAVTVMSQVTVIEFQNADGTLLQAYGEDEIEVGEIPDYTEAIPARASDAENIYIFRGFDKDIVPYAKSANKIIYKAVYESVRSTPRHVTLTKETVNGSEHAVFTLTGESKGVDTETIRNRAYLAFQKYQGDWSTKYSDAQAPIINADGSWVMQWDLDGTDIGNGNTWMGKYSWNVDSASGATDLKILHREDHKRYRHDGVTGVVIEDNQIGDNWDGVLPEDYVTTGHYGDDGEGNPLTSTNLSEENRQKFADAVGAPTWVGLGVTYDAAQFVIDGKIWELFTDASVWYLPSVRTKGLASATSATLEQDDDGIYYVVNSSLNMDGVAAADLEGEEHNTIDFQHNSNIDGAGWDYIKQDLTATKVVIADDGKTAKFMYRIDVDGIKDQQGTYTVHWGMPNRSDLKVAIADDFEAIKKDGILYSIRRDSSTWNIPSLVIGEVFDLELSEVGYTVSGDKINLNLKGQYEEFAGLSGTIEINQQTAPVSFDASGNFDFTRDVTDLMAVNTGSGYDSSKAYSIYLNMTFGDLEKKYSFVPGEQYTSETKFHEISVQVGSDYTNYVFTNKDGRLKVTTVNSLFTSSQLELYEKEDKAMLHVVGVMSKSHTSDGLKLAINNLNSDDNFAVAVPAGGVDEYGALDFEIDVTGYTNAASGLANANRLYLVNSEGRAARGGNETRGLNWTWMNDWSLGINKYGPVTVGGKVYTLSNGNNATLTVADAEPAA